MHATDLTSKSGSYIWLSFGSQMKTYIIFVLLQIRIGIGHFSLLSVGSDFSTSVTLHLRGIVTTIWKIASAWSNFFLRCRISYYQSGEVKQYIGYCRRADNPSVANPRLSTFPDFLTPLSCSGSVDSASSHCPKTRKTLLGSQLTLTIAPWSPMKKGSNGVCALWSVAEPSQNKKRKARPDKTEGAKRCLVARG